LFVFFSDNNLSEMDDLALLSTHNRSNHEGLLPSAASLSPTSKKKSNDAAAAVAAHHGPQRYLSTKSMRATANSMALVSSVLGFEIVEIWSEQKSDGKFHCTYVHVDPAVTAKYPNIITGHFPQHKKEHIISPQVRYLLLYCVSFLIASAFSLFLLSSL
jgi:hypothetical protein